MFELLYVVVGIFVWGYVFWVVEGVWEWDEYCVFVEVVVVVVVVVVGGD